MPLVDYLAKRFGLYLSVGSRGERFAVRHLKKHGYRILARNLRSKVGEIDILAEAPDRRTIAVIEVKSATTRTDQEAGPQALRPEVHVNPVKQKKIVAVACGLIRRMKLGHRPVRFDVIGVDIPNHATPVVRHHEGAFESTF